MNSRQSITCSMSPSLIHFLFCVLVVFLTFATISSSYTGRNETDYQALLQIKLAITKDPYGALTSWNSSLHFCDWTGVACGKWHSRVTSVDLESQGLEGYLSPFVGNLSFLRVFSLQNNSFEGVIPHELGRLSRLQFLYLGRNKFNSYIPTNISSCLNLIELHLSRNELVGSIPNEIGFLTKLTLLSLQYNKLTGGIPSFLGNITTMEVFSVVQNPLGGNIPSALGHWQNLKEYYSSSCRLSGTIPHSLYNLSFLAYISLADNKLTGNLPLTIGAMLPNLVLLEVWGNQLNGPLPRSISNCSRLTDLEVSINKFSGKLTIDFSNLRDVNFIGLYDNHFGSKDDDELKFLNSLQNCTKLETLDLSNCKFQGMLPKSIGNLSDQLRTLYISGYKLHGMLPRSIYNLVGLRDLQLGQNKFTGNILPIIGNLQRLQRLGLSENQLYGQIPNTIGHISSFLALDLSSNKLDGLIPSSLGNCYNLLELNLSDNKLYGEIPKKLLQLSNLSKSLDLSQNNFNGSLPTQVGDLKMLTTLDLSDNNLSGNIPDNLGNCDSLLSVSLKGNLFQGVIPPTLISLKALVELDVSHNNLSGQIPTFLEQLALQHLNMSYNDFEGELPVLGVFSNESSFPVLGNSKLCGGLIGLQLPRCTKKKQHTSRFPILVMGILIGSVVLSIICLAYVSCKKKRKYRMTQSLMSGRLLKVSYSQLHKATNGFSEDNLIGIGGFGSVYKGILSEEHDISVAVKVLYLQNQGALGSFMRECEAWRNIRHRNLLKIITACSSIDFLGKEFKALVYEFMPNGNLHDWLHSSEGNSRLNLIQIINILIDVASALDYIHNHSLPTIVHGDLKPSNILLDGDMVAHIGDFGLAHFLGTTSYQYRTIRINGTIGYAAPEYGLGGEMTCSGDIYSFGILLLETMTGKKPTNDAFNESISLHKFASMALPDNVMDVIDVNIQNVFQEDSVNMKNKEMNAKKVEECLCNTPSQIRADVSHFQGILEQLN